MIQTWVTTLSSRFIYENRSMTRTNRIEEKLN